MNWIEHLPAAARAEGPYHLAWWQLLALPALLLGSWVAGMFLARVLRSLLALAARRTRFTWDDEIIDGIGGPLPLACAGGVARLLVAWLPLPGAWRGGIAEGLRTVALVALFWVLLRVVTVAGTV